VGDDGPEAVAAGPEGAGYPHFLLQTLLRRLRGEGVLLAAVSKNDDDVARAPLRSGRLLLQENDFVAILASWQPKSAQLRALADRLNLGLDAFVFLDDNPVELAEVAQELPQVACVRFVPEPRGLVAVLAELRARFARRVITAEDRERTALYQRRLEGMQAATASGSDLTQFLRELDMTLTIHDRSRGDRTRAVQLINKTNQFNLNGERLVDAEVERVLADGGRLLTASLADRTGSHGEILACLMAADGQVCSLVLSCRVFQRRVEFAFLGWLAARGLTPRSFRYAPTDRNGPLRQFLAELLGEVPPGGAVAYEPAHSAPLLQDALALFRVAESATDG
jgi:FkbH-like protein